MAEKEYIEAKDLDDFRNDIMDKFLSLCNYNDYNKLTLLRIGETIDDAYYKYVSKPLADVAEVVRCKDCKYFIQDAELDHNEYPNIIEADGLCDCSLKLTDADDFCSNGERKE